MSKTPFIYLRDNIDKIKFICDEPQKKAFRNAFFGMLTRLDNYFVQNHLYACNNYQKLVEDMISGKKPFKFVVDDKMREDWAGYCTNGYDGKGNYIALKSEYLGKGATSEGLLCHEFFHHLTVGQNTLEYNKNNRKYIMQMSDGRKFTYEKGGTEAIATDYTGNLLNHSTFINEGLTELSKQQVFGLNECFGAYKAQTAMVKFLNSLTGGKNNLEAYLRGCVPNYSKYLGLNNNHVFIDMCNTYQDCLEDGDSKAPYTQDDLFIKAQDHLVNSVLDSLKNIAYELSAKEVVNMIKTIVRDAPVKRDYMDQCKESINLYSFASPKAKMGEREYFERILKDAINTSILGDEWTLPDSPATKEIGDMVSFYLRDGKIYINAQGSTLESIDNLGAGMGIQNSATDTWISFSKEKGGHYSVSLKSLKTKEVREKFYFALDENNPNKIVVSVPDTAEKYNINFDRLIADRKRQIEISTNLLDNFEYCQAIVGIINDSDVRIGEIKTIKNQNGEEYLIATTNKEPKFYKVTNDSYEKVEISSKTAASIGCEIYNTIFAGQDKDKKLSLKDYNKTGPKTEEDSIVYTLADGTQFVSYTKYDKEGKNGEVTYGEQIQPYATREDKYIVAQPSTLLYESSNKSLSEILKNGINLKDDIEQGVEKQL